MQEKPIIRPVAEVAAMFGCTVDQVRAQFAYDGIALAMAAQWQHANVFDLERS